MATELGVFPLEIWEKVLECFVLTINPNAQNRSAILSVCSALHHIAEPLMYRNIAIFEKGNQLAGVGSLAETLDRFPNYASRIKSLTVQFSLSQLSRQLSDDEVVERFHFLEWMQEMKSFSMAIYISDKQHANSARWLSNEVLKKIPSSCRSLELRLRCSDHNIRSHEYNPHTEHLVLPVKLGSLRLEALIDPKKSFWTLRMRGLNQLKEVVIKSDRLSRRPESVRLHDMTRRRVSEYARYVIAAVENDKMPTLERMLLYIQHSIDDDMTANADIDRRLKHVKKLTYKELYGMLHTEGTDVGTEELLDGNKGELTEEHAEDEGWKNRPVGNKWLMYKSAEREEGGLLGIIYTFVASPFSYEILEDQGIFFWCSTTNGVRMPVKCVANSELTRSPKEVKRRAKIQLAASAEQEASHRLCSGEPQDDLSGVFFKTCKDMDIALQD